MTPALKEKTSSRSMRVIYVLLRGLSMLSTHEFMLNKLRKCLCEESTNILLVKSESWPKRASISCVWRLGMSLPQTHEFHAPKAWNLCVERSNLCVLLMLYIESVRAINSCSLSNRNAPFIHEFDHSFKARIHLSFHVSFIRSSLD